MAEENEQEVYRPYVAELADKRGYIHPIHAKQLAEERTVTMTGDVTGSANWDFGEPATTGQSSESMALTIGNKKVTTEKIDDKAVGSGQMADHSVGLTQIDTNAITSTATSTGADKDKLITSEGVRNAIDNAIEGRGIDYGPMTVDQINALTDIPTGSTAHIIAGGTATVITDGDLPVRIGEDVKYHISGNSHGWYSLDGEFKLKQTAKTDPTASGTTITAIDSITQNENGEITATKKTIRTGNASDTGVVKLSDSHTSDSSTNGGVAATPAAVKAAYDLAAGKKDKQTPLDTDTGSGSGKGGTTKTLTRLVQDADGAITPTFSNIADASGSSKGLMSSADYTKLSGIAAGAEVNQNAFGNVKVGDVTVAADSKTDTLEIVGGTGIDATGDATNDKVTVALDSATQTSLGKADSAVQGVKLDGASSALTPDANKVVTIPNAAPTGTGATNGLMTAADKAKLDNVSSGANKVEASNTNGNIKIDGTETNVYTHPSAGPSSATSVGDTTNQTPTFGGTFKAISQTVNTDGHTTATAEHTVTLPTDGKDLTSTVTTENNYTNPGSTATALKTLFGKIWNFIGRLRTSWQTTPDDSHFPSEKLVKDSLDLKAPLASPALTGTPTAPTASAGTNTTQIATTAFVHGEIDAQKYGSPVSFYGIKITKKITDGIYDYIAFSVSDGFYGKPGKVSVGLRLPAGTSSTPIASGSLYNRFADGAPNSNYGASLTRIYYKVVDANIEFYILNSTGNSSRYGVIENLTPSNVPVTFSVLTSSVDATSLTELTWTSNKKGVAIPTAGTAVGSAAIPVYINESGDAVQCTDDFVHGPSSATADDIAVFDGTTGKLVKDGGKKISDLALADSVVAIADSVISGDGASGNGLWYKVAELKNPKTGSSAVNITGIWDLVINRALYCSNVTLEVNVRISGSTIVFTGTKAFSDDNSVLSDFSFKVVTRGAPGNVQGELWVGRPSASSFFAVAVIERNSGDYSNGTNKKTNWNYTSYRGNGGDAPVEDETTNVLVHDVEKLSRKHTQSAVSDPTASGTSLSFIDSFTQNANGEATVTKKSVTVDSTPTASSNNPVSSGGVASALDGKQNSLPTSGTASSTYAINISGNAATSTKPNTTVLTSSDNLDNIKGSSHGDVLYYSWLAGNAPTGVNAIDGSGNNITAVMEVVRTHPNNYCTQTVYTAEKGAYRRIFVNGTWGSWSKISTNADVASALASYAPLASPALTGTPTAPTAASGTNTTQIATTAFVQGALSGETNVGKSVGAAISTTKDANNNYWQKLCTFTVVGWSRALGILTSEVTDQTGGGVYVIEIGRLADNNGAPTFATIRHFGRFPQNKTKRKFAYTYDSSNSLLTLYTATSGYYTHNFKLLRSQNFTWFVSTDATAIPSNTTEITVKSSITSDNWNGSGSTSIPVYVDADGQVKACTDDFARDSEVVTNVEYVAAQSGGGGNINKTKNGTTTSVLAFMSDAEAIDLWRTAWDEAD